MVLWSETPRLLAGVHTVQRFERRGVGWRQSKTELQRSEVSQAGHGPGRGFNREADRGPAVLVIGQLR